MEVSVRISFPCSNDEWKKLCAIRSLVGEVETKASITAPIELLEEVTSKEALLLDEMSKKAHENNETPFMDSLEKDGRSAARRGQFESIRSLALQCLRANRGSATKDMLLNFIRPIRTDMTDKKILVNLYSNCGKDIKRASGVWALPEVP